MDGWMDGSRAKSHLIPQNVHSKKRNNFENQFNIYFLKILKYFKVFNIAVYLSCYIIYKFNMRLKKAYGTISYGALRHYVKCRVILMQMSSWKLAMYFKYCCLTNLLELKSNYICTLYILLKMSPISPSVKAKPWKAQGIGGMAHILNTPHSQGRLLPFLCSVHIMQLLSTQMSI